jgi:hypothetical protein
MVQAVMSFNSVSKTLKAGLKGSAFFMLFFVFQVHADWAGRFEGEGRSQRALHVSTAWALVCNA